MHEPDARPLKFRSREALADVGLQAALAQAREGFIDRRAAAVHAVPEWQAIRDEAKAMKNHVLAHLDQYLEQYEAAVCRNGGEVHWARDADEAGNIVVELCRQAEAKTVAKGKSMVGEEAQLNERLLEAGMEPIETDLGEYIIQLAGEAPSHIIAPAIHKTREQVVELFRSHHGRIPETEGREDRKSLVTEARIVLRQRFLEADVGITGANFLIADSGQHVLVTNEGNGDLCSVLPRVLIVIVGIEKVVPTLEDATQQLRLLARSATGQSISNYTSVMSGPRRAGDIDGPEQFHVVLVDGERSALLGSELSEVLRCIRCGACINHCPVYGKIGGHAYGWVYPGPIGSVITPAFVGLENAPELPHACTLNGRCAEVCPMSIPLPDLLRKHRQSTFERELQAAGVRRGLWLWAFVACRPKLYRFMTGLGARLLSMLGRGGRFKHLPLAGGWTQSRDWPAPQGGSFFAQYARQRNQIR